MEHRNEDRKDIKARDEVRKDRFRVVKLEERIAPSQLIHIHGPAHVKVKL